MSVKVNNKKLKSFAKSNDFRIVAFFIETPKGSTFEFEGCVTISDSEKVAKLVEEIIKLTNRTEASHDNEETDQKLE